MACCPTCGRKMAVKTPKRPQNDDPVSLKDLTDTELFAHYKRTAPVEDVRFWLRSRMSDELRDDFNLLLVETLQGTIKAADYKRRFVELKDAWRRERNALQPIQIETDDDDTLDLDEDPIGNVDMESVA